VSARAGYKVLPHYGFDGHPPIDVLIVSGGVHVDQMKNTRVAEWILQQAQCASLVASVCTGAFLLAQAKVLDKHKVTTHWEDTADLRTMFPELNVIEKARWVDEGRIITSGGISAGIDMCLHIVSKLYDADLAERTARQMDYAWTRSPHS
jgi:transcriptional regulator GlxA family with amidase domain